MLVSTLGTLAGLCVDMGRYSSNQTLESRYHGLSRKVLGIPTPGNECNWSVVSNGSWLTLGARRDLLGRSRQSLEARFLQNLKRAGSAVITGRHEATREIEDRKREMNRSEEYMYRT